MLALQDGRQLVGGSYFDDTTSTFESGWFLVGTTGKITRRLPLAQELTQLHVALELADHRVLIALAPNDSEGPVSLLRFNSDLTVVESTFAAELDGVVRIRALAEMADKTVLVAGEFTNSTGQISVQLRRLKSTGANLGWTGEGALPRFTQRPSSLTVREGGSAQFQAAGTGDQPVTYLWFRGSEPLIGATNSTLVLNLVRTVDAAEYRVLLRTPTQSVRSAPATLTVLPRPNPPVLNVQRSANLFRLTYSLTPGVSYQLETSGDLIHWSASAPFTAETESQSVDVTPVGETEYWRLRAQP